MARRSSTGVQGLYRDKDGRYRIDLRHPGGRHKERLPPGTTGVAARLRAQKVLELALTGKLVKGARDAPRGLRQAFDRYLEWIKGPGAGEYVEPERTHDDKSSHADAWITAVGDVPISTLGTHLFDRFKEHEAGRGIGPATINRRLTTIKHFIKWAAARGWLDKARAVEMRTE
jgi:hypothetical protein